MITCNDCIHFGVCMGFNKCKRFERRENATMRITGYEVDGGKLSAVYITDETRGIEQKKYVEDRPHGEWIQQPTMEGHTWYECSVCKSWIQDVSCYDYCPNCGARMEKEGEAE